MEICDSKKCTGCGVCVCICPQGAVKMEKDLHGFLYPIVDSAKCISCNLCMKNCPINRIIQLEENGGQYGIYAGWVRDKRIRLKTKTAGVFYSLACEILREHGVVAGVRWSKDFHAEYTIVSCIDDLHELHGSKYVQCHTGRIYEVIKEKLSAGVPVLFSGTPCQNAALKAFLGKPYENLLQMDFPCHGVPSEDVLDRWKNEISEKYNCSASEIINIDFAKKVPYWNHTKIEVRYKKGIQYSCHVDTYMGLFKNGYSLRESCRRCQFASLKRNSDITSGDFWGYKPRSFAMKNFDKGVALLLLNSEKGKAFFDVIKQRMLYENRPLEEALASNYCLHTMHSQFEVSDKKIHQFWTDYDANMGIGELAEKYLSLSKPVTMMWLRNFKNRWWWIVDNLLHRG